jgi:hypothetical protein
MSETAAGVERRSAARLDRRSGVADRRADRGAASLNHPDDARPERRCAVRVDRRGAQADRRSTTHGSRRVDRSTVRVAVLYGFASMYEHEPIGLAYALDEDHLPFGCWSMIGLAEVCGWVAVEPGGREHLQAIEISSIWA